VSSTVRVVRVLVPLALTAWVYHRITHVFFFADDFVHFTEIVNDGPLVFLVKPFGGQAFLGRNLVYLGLYHVFGVDPVPLQSIVLLTHLVNVGIAFAALRTFTRSAWLACLGATVFGTAPLVAGTLGWYALFGHVLIGTILWIVLGGMARVAAGERGVGVRTAVFWCLLLLVGSTCYGPGMGVAFAFPFAAVVLLPDVRRPRILAVLAALPVATLGLYLGLRYAYTFVGPLPIEEIFQQEYALSGFETIPPFFGHLLAYSAAGTLLGFFLRGYPAPTAWVGVALLAGGVALVVWRGGGAARRVALAMVVLWLGTYLVIAAGRAHVYAIFKIPPATAATTARYHYAGLIPVVVLMCTTLQVLGRVLGRRPVAAGAAVALLLGVWTYGYVRAGFHFDEHPFAHDWFLTTRNEIAAAVASAPRGTVYIENGKTPGYVLGPAIPDAYFPGRAAVFLLTHPAGRLDGRDVRFIERDSAVLDWYANERPTLLGRLLVAPADVPKD
jgi:hypothetical protein